MRKRILQIPPFQVALMVTFISIVLSYPFIGAMWMFNQFEPNPRSLNWINVILFSLLTGVCAFVVAVLVAVSYNLIAKLGIYVTAFVDPGSLPNSDAPQKASTPVGSALIPSSETIRIEYELKFRDYALFNAMHQLSSIRLHILLLSASLYIFSISNEEQGFYVRTAGAAISYLAMWAAQLVLSVIFLYSNHNKSLLTRHIILLQDDGLYEETDYGRAHHYWPGILKIVTRPGFVAVYVSALGAHVIPDRAFSSLEQRERFVFAVNEKINSAHG